MVRALTAQARDSVYDSWLFTFLCCISYPHYGRVVAHTHWKAEAFFTRSEKSLGRSISCRGGTRTRGGVELFTSSAIRGWRHHLQKIHQYIHVYTFYNKPYNFF